MDKNSKTYFKSSYKNFGKSDGWFFGRFMGEYNLPQLKSDAVEVAWKVLGGDPENSALHYHKEAPEINIVLSGKCTIEVGGRQVTVKGGEFVVIYPGTRARAVSYTRNTQLMVIKTPSVAADKYYVEK